MALVIPPEVLPSLIPESPLAMVVVETKIPFGDPVACVGSGSFISPGVCGTVFEGEAVHA